MKNELKIRRLSDIRKKLLELNSYPEIIGTNETSDYPETKIEKAYCTLLWEIDEETRREIRKNK